MNRSYIKKWCFLVAVFLPLQIAIILTSGLGVLLENKTGQEIHSVTVLYPGGEARIDHLGINESRFTEIFIDDGNSYTVLTLEIQPEENGVILRREAAAHFPGGYTRGKVRITLDADFSTEFSQSCSDDRHALLDFHISLITRFITGVFHSLSTWCARAKGITCMAPGEIGQNVLLRESGSSPGITQMGGFCCRLRENVPGRMRIFWIGC